MRAIPSPVSVLYGGAQLFRSDGAAKLGRIARGSFERYLPDAASVAEAFAIEDASLAASVRDALERRLEAGPVDDLRVDFEDGYGARPAEEEDAEATRVGGALAEGHAAGSLPPHIGVRTKAFSGGTRDRSLRTLRLVLAAFVERGGGAVPSSFVWTLPKVRGEAEVRDAACELARAEADFGQPEGAIAMELLVETPDVLVAPDGRVAIRSVIDAAGDRCRSVHLGAYDLLSSVGVLARDQSLAHPLCALARMLSLLAVAGTGAVVSDGATNELPIAPHGAPTTEREHEENRRAVHRAWRRHAADVRRAIGEGIFLGWDLHPNQLVSRYATLFLAMLEEAPRATARMRRFLDDAAVARRSGQEFDDAATALGVLNFFARGVALELFDDEALAAAGLTREGLDHRDFARMAEAGRMSRSG